MIHNKTRKDAVNHPEENNNNKNVSDKIGKLISSVDHYQAVEEHKGSLNKSKESSFKDSIFESIKLK